MTVDGDGNVLSVAVSEPRFTPHEKALLLASRRVEDEPRGSHGILISEATDPKLQDQWVTEPVTDFAQRLLNSDQERWREQYGDVLDMSAILWRLKRKDA